MNLLKNFNSIKNQLAIDNVPADTRRCRALKSSAGEEGGSYDVSDDMLQKHCTELFEEVELSLCLQIQGLLFELNFNVYIPQARVCGRVLPKTC